MSIIKEIESQREQLGEWRRALHQRPETAFQEVWTSGFIAEKLEALGIDFHHGLATTGIVATINGRAKADKPRPAKTIGLRADMDALDIQEKNPFDHRSIHQGKMHACGHDGHSAMLLGAAQYLSKHPDFYGTVHLIFQPAEENEGGARVMIEEGLFEKFPMDAVYGMHNLPGLAVGKMKMSPGPCMAGADSFDIEIKAKGTHAAMPDRGSDAIVIQAHLVTALQSIVSRNINPIETSVLSVTQVHGGSTYNVIPENVSLRGTVRAFKPEIQQQIENRIKEICQHIGACFNAEIEFTYLRRYPPVVNHPDHVDICEQVAIDVFGSENVTTQGTPTMGAEDFAFMLQKKPGCYVFIGNGDGDENSCMLHNPNYDFNDDIITMGSSYWVKLVGQALQAP